MFPPLSPLLSSLARFLSPLHPPPALPPHLPHNKITKKKATNIDNLSGTEEMFVPRRFIFGLLPSGLVENHDFWMDDNDVIR